MIVLSPSGKSPEHPFFCFQYYVDARAIWPAMIAMVVERSDGKDKSGRNVVIRFLTLSTVSCGLLVQSSRTPAYTSR